MSLEIRPITCHLQIFHGGVGVVGGCTIMGVSGVQQGAQDAALGGADVEGAAAEVPNSDLQHLCSAGQKVQDQSRAKSSGPDP